MIAVFQRIPARRRAVAMLAALPLGIGMACWWFTEPLDPPAASASRDSDPAPPPPAPPLAKLEWPAARLDGQPAKSRLLDLLLSARRRLDRVRGYTATFRRQERIGGKLGPEQVLRLKSRPDPFAIYLKFESPQRGKEVVFARGRHDDKLVAHSGDWKDRLIPRVKLDPRGALALADSRHPITEAGLVNLTDRLLGYRRLDLSDPGAVTVLDRVVDPDGAPRLQSVHTHPVRKPDRPFARVEVLYEPETFLPLQISNYDWPEPGQAAGEPRLAERYGYQGLDLDATLTDLDFDPANPAYAFSRF